MRYLVTGGAGFIGSHLADALVRRGDSLTVLDDLSTGNDRNLEHLMGSGRVELVQGSVLDAELTDRLVSEADTVVHLAATVGVQLVVRDPLMALKNNILGTETMLEACSRYGVKTLIASTSEIYGKNGSDRLSEEADQVVGPPTRTRWAYATSKAVDEIFAYEYFRQRGTPTIVVRLFNCSGPRQTGAYGMVIPRFVRQALTGEDLTVFGDGYQTRCFCHVEDTVRAILGVLEEPQAIGGVFNIGGTDEISIRTLAERVIQLAGSDSGIRHMSYEEAYEPGFEDLQRRVPDTTRIRRLIGWEPRLSVADIIIDVLAYERQAIELGAPAR
jgi:nucleoside-diphosphate-sugar epimerase